MLIARTGKANDLIASGAAHRRGMNQNRKFTLRSDKGEEGSPSHVLLVLASVGFHIHDDDCDVVLASGGIGGLDESAAADFARQVRRQDWRNLVLGDHVRETVAAKEKAIPRLDLDRPDLGHRASPHPETG